MKDLRSYLASLKADLPDELVEVEAEVDPLWEVSAIAQKFEEKKQYPVLHFKKLKGSRFPLVMNLFASRRRCAHLLGASPENAAASYTQRLGRKGDTVYIEPADAPVKQVIRKNEEVDLFSLPVVTHHAWDAGPYLTAGMATMRWQVEGHAYNTGLYRCYVKEPRRMGIFLSVGKHNWHMMRENSSKGESTRVAIWIGHHPEVYFGAQAKNPFFHDDYAATSGFIGEPLRLTASETWGRDFLVPADAEVVIEGTIPADLREVEAPFGEYTRYYGEQRYGPVVEVAALTHRREPIYQDIFVAHPDNQIFGAFPIEDKIFKSVREVVPNVKSVYLPLSGCCRFFCYLSIGKRIEGEGKLALTAAIPVDSRVKYFVVVDEDVDVFNEAEVLWAIATRTKMPDDLIIVTNTIGEALDPMAEGEHLVNKMGIDATRPLGPFPERVSIPKDVLERVALEKFIPAGKLAKVATEK
jgi:2,5-furandicarboxylate decarboxylase 1